MTIGERIRLIRSKQSLGLEKTVEALANAKCPFYITAQTLSRYETGKRTPDNDFLEAFGKHFEVHGNWLLYGEAPIFKSFSLGKDLMENFLELAAQLHTTPQRDSSIPRFLRASLSEFTKDTPENFILLLEYMLKDMEIREDIFTYFHVISRPRYEKRMENSGAEK